MNWCSTAVLSTYCRKRFSQKRDAEEVLISESVFVHRAWAFWRSDGPSFMMTHFYLRLRNDVVFVIGITGMTATSDLRPPTQETKKSILEYYFHSIFMSMNVAPRRLSFCKEWKPVCVYVVNGRIYGSVKKTKIHDSSLIIMSSLNFSRPTLSVD